MKNAVWRVALSAFVALAFVAPTAALAVSGYATVTLNVPVKVMNSGANAKVTMTCTAQPNGTSIPTPAQTFTASATTTLDATGGYAGTLTVVFKTAGANVNFYSCVFNLPLLGSPINGTFGPT
jgi:hypothetical protein